MLFVVLFSLFAPVALAVLVPSAALLTAAFTAVRRNVLEQPAVPKKTAHASPLVRRPVSATYLPVVVFVLVAVSGSVAALSYGDDSGRIELSDDVSQVVTSGRDPAIEEGRRLLHDSGRLSCTDCHAFNRGEAGSMLNLFDVGSRLIQEELVTAVRAPSKTIHIDFPTVRLTTVDGRRLEGRVISDDGRRLQFRDATGSEKSITHADIEDLVALPSPMPEGQADGLTGEEFAKLITYLASLKG